MKLSYDKPMGTCRIVALPLALALLAGAASAQAASPVFSTLYAFSDQNGDGAYPFAGVTIGQGGILYGATEVGGIIGGACTFGCGTVFEVQPSGGGAWTETVLYEFTGSNGDGSGPEGTLVIGKDGTLYGTTADGGVSNCGTVFQLTPGMPWTKPSCINSPD